MRLHLPALSSFCTLELSLLNKVCISSRVKGQVTDTWTCVMSSLQVSLASFAAEVELTPHWYLILETEASQRSY